MSERATLEAEIVKWAKVLRRMHLHGFASAEDFDRLYAATDALIAYEESHGRAQDAVRL